MFKYLSVILLILTTISYEVRSNEDLTIQQKLDRLQREVSDLSKTVFSQKENINSDNNNSDFVKNLSAIDMRIYDLEKDVKNLTANIEEILFQIEDVMIKINNFQNNVSSIENKLIENNKTSLQQNNNEIKETNKIEENTLGSLKISSEPEINKEKDNDLLDTKEETKLSPEDQFQVAFDNIRSKKWDDAKILLTKFIENYPDNQLSGSAHYWLGELYILEKKYRDAALIFAEGYQKFPKSIKAPDMLFKLSISLNQVDKKIESCKTLEKLIMDYPKNKFIKNANKNIQDYGCLEASE